MLSPNRTEDVVATRCLVVTYCKGYGLSNKTLQDVLCFRSHNSIRYYIDMYSNRVGSDRFFRSADNYASKAVGKRMAELGQ